jgi:transposase
MTGPNCAGCRERDAVIAVLLRRVEQLEERVRELEARLGNNASNSHLPPSASPPAAPKPVVKKRSRRRRGGQPGHQGHHRALLPPELVDHTVPFRPARCERCAAALPASAAPGDPEPTRHQLFELPRRCVVVTEYQGHARACPCCSHVTRAAVPAELRRVAFGPRLAASLSYLSGCQHVSARGLEEVVEALYGVPIALGTVAALQGQLSQALRPAHEWIGQEVRAAAVKNVDETGWKQAGQKRWLWVAVTRAASYFLVQARRSAAALKGLLGAEVPGLIGSDRWSAYSGVPLARRQICWAHLKRDFQAMVDAGGGGQEVGQALLGMTERLFDSWHKVKAGGRTRHWLTRQLRDFLRPRVRALLEEGAACRCAKTAGMCGKILEVEEALWTFTRQEGVEPTNNAAERALRTAVIKRKKSFGSHSAAGCTFVSRLLSVAQTVRQRGGAVLDYLSAALDAFRHGLAPPPLPNAT